MNSYCFCLRCRHWSSSVFTLATLPICHRCASQATVTSVSFRNRTAIFTFHHMIDRTGMFDSKFASPERQNRTPP